MTKVLVRSYIILANMKILLPYNNYYYCIFKSLTFKSNFHVPQIVTALQFATNVTAKPNTKTKKDEPCPEAEKPPTPKIQKFKIYRYDPDKKTKPQMKTYEVDLNE